MLFPIKMAVSTLLYESATFKAFCADLSPFLAFAFSLILFTQAKAVSLAEKTAESARRISITR